jgi:serine/threonine protein kinase
MALVAGTKLGPYEIQSPLGAGGMGEVYRARDTRLGRDVALKILPESFARDLDRLERFEQEARALAALNHPSILSIFDIGANRKVPFLIAELLEGESVMTEDTFSTGTPTPLFQFHGRAGISSTDVFSYDVGKDGKRFLVNCYVKPEYVAPLTIGLAVGGNR